MIDKSGELKGTEAELPLLEIILQRRDKINEHLQKGVSGKQPQTIGGSLVQTPHQEYNHDSQQKNPSPPAGQPKFYYHIVRTNRILKESYKISPHLRPWLWTLIRDCFHWQSNKDKDPKAGLLYFTLRLDSLSFWTASIMWSKMCISRRKERNKSKPDDLHWPAL